MKPEELAELMQTLDDAWNAGPNSKLWDTFRKRHTEDVAVYWPGQPDPTRGRRNHDLEAVEFFKMFPDNHLINRPYKIFFAAGNHTCSVADFTGTMKGPMKMGGKTIPPTNRKLQGGILHAGYVERSRGDHRGTPVLRPRRAHAADRPRLAIRFTAFTIAVEFIGVLRPPHLVRPHPEVDS